MKEKIRSIINCNSYDGMTKRLLNLRVATLRTTGIRRFINLRRYNRLLKVFSCDIPIETEIDTGLTLPHGGNGIFISRGAKIGANCTIFQQVTIGSNTLKDSKRQGAPVIGNNVYIGAGAKIIGGIHIGNNVRIGANAVVTVDVPDNATVVMNHPRILMKEHRDNSFMTY